MLAFLRDSGNLSQRKARLFACGAVRRVWHLLTDERSRRAVEVAERYAEGAVPASTLEEAHRAAWDAHWKQDEESGSEAVIVFASEAAAGAARWESSEVWRRQDDHEQM